MQPGAPPIIMLVDDDEDLLFMMKTRLEKEGYRVEARTSAPRREDITGTRPAMIFMDIGLKDENGAALCSAIKRDARAAGTPVVLISGKPDEQLHRDATLGLADDRLSKPFTMQELLDQAARYTGGVNA